MKRSAPNTFIQLLSPRSALSDLPFFIFSLSPTCILHPSRTQVFMIIGTQDTKHVQCNRTIPPHRCTLTTLRQKKNNQKRQRANNQERKRTKEHE